MASIETWVAGIISLLPDRYEDYERRADYEAFVAIVRMVWAEGNDYVDGFHDWIASRDRDDDWERELDADGRSWMRAYRALALYVRHAGVPTDAVEEGHLPELMAHAERLFDVAD
jgi:hypothetical protein